MAGLIAGGDAGGDAPGVKLPGEREGVFNHEFVVRAVDGEDVLGFVAARARSFAAAGDEIVDRAAVVRRLPRTPNSG